MMVIDNRTLNTIELRKLAPGEGFVFDGTFFMKIDPDTTDVPLGQTPAVNIDDGSYTEFANSLAVSPCTYKTFVHDV